MTARAPHARRRLIANRDGLALLEFALILPPLLLILALVVDLGICFNARLNMMRGVTAGAHYALENGGDVTLATADAFRTTVAAIVTDAAGDVSTPIVTISINGTAGSATANGFYCISGYPVQWRSTGTSSASCGDATSSAKFVTIAVDGAIRSVIPILPIGTRLFPLKETILVRAR